MTNARLSHKVQQSSNEMPLSNSIECLGLWGRPYYTALEKKGLQVLQLWHYILIKIIFTLSYFINTHFQELFFLNASSNMYGGGRRKNKNM